MAAALDVVVLYACDLSQSQARGPQDPFVVVRLGASELSTSAHLGTGRSAR